MASKVLKYSATFVILALIVIGTIRLQRLPNGPIPIAYDRDACAHCHMLIGDAHFSAQLITKEGVVLNFDDPGCLLTYRKERKPPIHQTWFHHGRRNTWINTTQVRFIVVDQSPMGYGMLAVDSSEKGSISAQDAYRIAQTHAAKHH